MKLVKADLLEYPASAIAHCCNCQNVFGAGIAAQIKDKIPRAYTADCIAAMEGRNILGEISVYNPEHSVHVINIYGQEFPGGSIKPLDYEAFYVGLKSARHYMETTAWSHVPPVLAFPYKIGCGLAGGSWEIVEPMINVVFRNTKFDVVICAREQDL